MEKYVHCPIYHVMLNVFHVHHTYQYECLPNHDIQVRKKFLSVQIPNQYVILHKQLF